MNADNYVLSGEKTELVLKKMEKQGYIIRVRERDGGGEETVEFIVGPRGKAEVGEKGVAGLVRKVWGKMGTEREELEKRLVRSLGDGVGIRKGRDDREDEGEGETQADAEEEAEGEDDREEERPGQTVRRRSSRGTAKTPRGRASGRRGRNALVDEEADGEEDEEEEEEEEEEEGAESEEE
ncbi:MAG: hypothetical protein L6R39_006810 [Caloplaca ligustica]|nr:MAG: hypothetical protein L6R39_006810 [Caloplaca ligustica]